ncbi:putative inorganic phosphate cotransporter [Trichonephila clavipes]|nr:putative inorganic phosphate cotransporter [Trichonephila clavipes]
MRRHIGPVPGIIVWGGIVYHSRTPIDNARPHVARIVQRFFVNHQIELLPWPARSPDLSPIENMWSIVVQRLTQITAPAATPDQLWQRVEAAWSAVPQEHIQSLFESMPRRVPEGLSYPAMNTMIGRWAPELERSRISAAVYSGSAIGTVVSLTVSGWLCETDFLGGWPAVFYVFGFIGCVWWVFWILFISETPEDHPSISEEEISLYYQTEDDRAAHMSINVPWRKILTSVPMLGLLVGHVGSYFGITILMIEIPAYLNSVLHFSVQQVSVQE